ncbi:MAG: methionine synthase, partial [Chloroflexi bacterium CG07_land_8_20_14_0_80_51_10]
FIDEPYLASLGSAFVSLDNDTVISLTNEVLGGISKLKGMHCCGNTDWSVLLTTDIDILSFDAYNYGESLALYPAAVKAFLDRGGVLAWGIIPSEEATLPGETAPNLLARLEKLMRLLSGKGIDYDILLERCLITPTCGLSSISSQAAVKALELTAEVSREFRRSHKLT